MSLIGLAAAPALHISRALDDVGDGSGAFEATGNYTTPKEFRIVADPSHNFELFSATVVIVSNGISRFGYGNSLGLTTGIDVFVAHKNAAGTYVTDFKLHPTTVKFNHDWNKIAGADAHSDIDRIFANPVAVPAMFFTLDFVKLFGQPIVLRGDRAGKFVALHQDNYTTSAALLSHHIFMRGKMSRYAP